MRQTRPYMVIGLCRSLVYTCASTASNLCSHCPHPVLCTASYLVPTLPPTCANLLRFLYSPFYFHISSLSSNPPLGILSSILGRGSAMHDTVTIFSYIRSTLVIHPMENIILTHLSDNPLTLHATLWVPVLSPTGIHEVPYCWPQPPSSGR